MEHKVSKAQSEVWEWKEALYESAAGDTVEEKLKNLLNEPNSIYETLLKSKVNESIKQQGKSAVRIEIFKDQVNKYRFRLVAENGEIISTSDVYENKLACKKAIQILTENAQYAVIEEVSQ